MGRYWISARAVLPALLALLAVTNRAGGTEPQHGDLDPRWLIDPGRVSMPAPEPDLIRLQAHGEYQVRLRGQRRVSLPPYRGDPGTTELSQTTRLTHWLRFTPELQLGDRLRLVGQADIARGFIGGQPTQHVSASREPYDVQQPLRSDPRWLFAEYSHGLLGVAVGQQPSHWGLGLVENDGNHPTRWGDYEGGTRVERIEVRLHPAAADPPFELRLAGDLVFADRLADLRRDQQAVRAVASLRAGRAGGDSLGLLAVYRHQSEPLPVNESAPHAVTRRWTLDLTGQFAEPIPGLPAWVYGAFEAALQIGDSTLAPTLEQAIENERESIAATAAVARAGAIFTRQRESMTHGRLGIELEWGWTTGDADPYDGTQHRFALDPSYNVGLILFDEVLAWKSARAATIGEDPTLGPRPRPEVLGLPTDGAVFGATYVHPQVLFRPVADLDLRAGAVVAQTTADFVNPVAVYTQGRYENFDGGSPTAHDLGVEVMLGVDWRIPFETGAKVQIGAQAATFFPGHAFDDAEGARMKTQHAGIARIGVQY